MAKRQAVALCSSCDAPLQYESSFCANCGRPTVWASHDERVSWEVRQWRATRSSGSESATVMMLVRTEAGYEPALVDRPAEYRWNQPLHPEREAPLRSNPHAVRPTLGDRTTNGHAEPPAPAPVEPAAGADLRSTVAVEPTPIQHAGHAPVPATVEVPEPTRIEVPPAADDRVTVSKTPVAADDRVTVSKRAVAVGIVLALGLPLSGKVLNLSRSSPESSRASLAAPATAPARPVGLKAVRSGFSQASPDAARFAVVVQNPNRGYAARSVTVEISLFDGSGHLVGTDNERVAAVPAGSRVAVAGQTGVAGRVAGLGIRVSAGSFAADRLLRPFIVRDVRMTRSGRDIIVRATVSASRATHQARVVIVHLDRTGRVVGGDFTYVDVPRSPKTKNVVVSTTGVPGVARVEVFIVATV